MLGLVLLYVLRCNSVHVLKRSVATLFIKKVSTFLYVAVNLLKFYQFCVNNENKNLSAVNFLMKKRWQFFAFVLSVSLIRDVYNICISLAIYFA